MAYMRDITGVRLDDTEISQKRFVPAMPAGLAWDSVNYPVTVTNVREIAGTGRSVATLAQTPESYIDAVSACRSAPVATYYVNGTTGLDANAGSLASPFKSIWKAVVAANTAAVATKIIVAAGTYFRTNNPWYNGGSGVNPAVDIAFIASGGRVVTGTFDPPGTPSRDATHVNTYSWAVASVNRVTDMIERDRFGKYVELQNVSTAALCNATPNSWSLVSGTLYVNRRDQRAVINTNTRVYRAATSCVSLRTGTNIYIGGAALGDGFDFEGSSNIGVVEAVINPPSASKKVLVVRDCTMRYGGGVTDTSATAGNAQSWNGLAAFFNCAFDASQTDGINAHNTHGATTPYLLTVNCTGVDNGRFSNQSCNGWTTHEDVRGIDICGYYETNRGGTVRSIGTSKSWLVATCVRDDQGDLGVGGSLSPTAFRTDETAQFWCDRTRVLMGAAGLAYTAADTSQIHRRDPEPTGLMLSGAGTIDTY